MMIKATEIKGMVWFEGSDVEIAGVHGFSFLKVIRLMHEAKRSGEKTVYTVDALEVMLHLNETDVEDLRKLDINEAEVFGEYAVIRVSQNLYITEQIKIQYNYNLFEENVTDEEYVDRLVAEQELFNELIYGCKTSTQVAEEEVEEEDLLNN